MAIRIKRENEICSECGEEVFVRKYMLCYRHYRRLLRQYRISKPRKVSDPNKSFLYLYPELSQEWHPDRNGKLLPSDILPYTNVIVWWKCSENHSYEMNPYNRIQGEGCPYCSGNRLTPELSLAVKHPDIAAEWDYEKNVLRPEDVHACKKMMAWWKCPQGKGHPSYQASIDNRTNRKSGCPYCKGRLVCFENCLAIVEPDIAWEWHPVLNGDLTPFDVTSGSGKRVTWLCKTTRMHTWEDTVNKRSSLRSRCPYCFGKKIWSRQIPDVSIDWKEEYKFWYRSMVEKVCSPIVLD
ncbi:zinc-ribbon domain-containing protein [Paenibacillus allorhizosphaerae]|uniref:Treble clef zinc finger domain-containing protein n=1 Tax=Paenibacillus allorhizosphaerae TaxID=2849866 RepID=A0ABM8VNQ1_9BACL|nr:zinc-ribbon domain-containing protein [Paenibacillus allorhizosphaerae]CAG7651564.1 hypothetical protein PAECIP111802_04995 [Paenibacillus allorhizosphaerae]